MYDRRCIELVIRTERQSATTLELVMPKSSAILGNAGEGRVEAKGDTKVINATEPIDCHFFLFDQF
jgi:hypothetical protein